MSTLLQEIEAQIAGVKTGAAKQNVGVVREIGDGVAKIEGLTDAMVNPKLRKAPVVKDDDGAASSVTAAVAVDTEIGTSVAQPSVAEGVSVVARTEYMPAETDYTLDDADNFRAEPRSNVARAWR